MAGQTWVKRPPPLFQECFGFSRNRNSHFVGHKELCIDFFFRCISFKDVVMRGMSIWKNVKS